MSRRSPLVLLCLILCLQPGRAGGQATNYTYPFSVTYHNSFSDDGGVGTKLASMSRPQARNPSARRTPANRAGTWHARR